MQTNHSSCRSAAILTLLLATGVPSCREAAHPCEAGTQRRERSHFSLEERWCESEWGVKQGLYISWHSVSARHKFMEGRFVSGKQDGAWLVYDRAGRKRELLSFADGVAEGTWSYWHSNGVLWRQGEYHKDRKQGEWSYWDRHGAPLESVRYEAGEIEPQLGATGWQPSPASVDFASHRLQKTGVYPGPALRELSGIRWSFRVDCATARRPVVAGNAVFAACSGDDLAGEALPARVYALHLESGRELWRRDFGPVKVSPPSFFEGTLYLGAGRELVALDPGSGTTIWSRELPAGANAFSAPVVAGPTLYVGAGNVGILAIDLSDHSVKWLHAAVDSWVNAPLAIDEGLLVARFRAKPGLRAIDLTTGLSRWRFRAEGSARGAAAIFGGVVYFGSRDRFVYALDLQTGRPLWTFPTDQWIHASPVVSDDIVLVGSGDHTLYALDRATGEERWRFVSESFIEHAVAAVEDVAVFRSRDGRVYALDMETGARLWTFETDTPFGSAPVPTQGAVVFASADGYVYALE